MVAAIEDILTIDPPKPPFEIAIVRVASLQHSINPTTLTAIKRVSSVASKSDT